MLPTTDRQQTDEQAIAYSEREREFTFAKKSSAYLIDIYVLFDETGDAVFKNEVKTGTGSSFQRHFGKSQISGFSRPCISVIHLCSATTRTADQLVNWRRFGPLTWTKTELLCPGEPTPITLSVGLYMNRERRLL